MDESKGTPWNKAWHVVRVVRTVADGKIKVYFDDMERPMMTAQDDTFKWGQVGLGTFDDNGNFDNFELQGVKVPKPTWLRDIVVSDFVLTVKVIIGRSISSK